MKHWLTLIYMGIHCFATGQVTLNGFIIEKVTKENIPFASISIKSTSQGTSSNAYGFYSITLPAGKPIEIIISSIGYQNHLITFTPRNDTTINIEMDRLILVLDEVTIAAESQSLIQGKGVTVIRPEVTKNTPMLLGEKDILKTIQMLPGVKQGIEGSTGLYIRGGSPDQNLILLDEASVYNPNHLFGFFSVFNGDALKNTQVWKSGFPAQYGGRASSVIDIQMKEGNKHKLKGEAGIGLLSSRLTLEGPLADDNISFLISGRRSYIDLLTKPLMSTEDHQAYRFYDVNAKINLALNSKDHLYLSMYAGNDKLSYATIDNPLRSATRSDSRLGWGNLTTTLRWNHKYSEKLFGNVTLLQSKFRFYLNDELEQLGNQPRYQYASYGSSIRNIAGKNDFDYYINNRHHLKGGLHYTYHIYRPKAFEQIDRSLNLNERISETYKNHEVGIYAEDIWQVTVPFEVRMGLRYNALVTSLKTFHLFEPRLSASHELGGGLSLNASYTRANQFAHLLSNTGLGLSTDLWVPPTLRAPPVQTDLWSAGVAKGFPTLGIKISFETYRKYLRNILAYTEDASFLVLSESPQNTSWEANVVSGNGLSYGTELMVEKAKGRFTGFVAYTLSWTIHQFDSLNNGKRFFGRQDNRHSITISTVYRLKPEILISANWTLNSGIPLTAPHAYYYVLSSNFKEETLYQSAIPYFGSRNSFRSEAYHRLDVAIQFHKNRKRYSRYWEIGVFNAYNRMNPLYYYLEFQDSPGQAPTAKLKKKSLFPILPSVTYNIQF